MIHTFICCASGNAIGGLLFSTVLGWDNIRFIVVMVVGTVVAFVIATPSLYRGPS